MHFGASMKKLWDRIFGPCELKLTWGKQTCQCINSWAFLVRLEDVAVQMKKNPTMNDILKQALVPHFIQLVIETNLI